MTTRRQAIAAALCCAFPAWSQQAPIAPTAPPGSAVVRPYRPVEVPPARLANSARLRVLIRAGTLYLTKQDAIALALENNIDLEIARYNSILASWRVERAEAGGFLPGVPSNASQAGSVAAGQGVAGSQAAAGVRIAGAGNNNGQSGNATISQIGPVTQTLDPTIQEASTFSHTTTPQPNIVQSITPVLINDTRAHSLSMQQGFLSGGSVTVKYTDNYLRENSPTDLLNPSSAPTLSVAAQHNLLRGFGMAVNSRTITVARMSVDMSELNFRTQVAAVVTQVLRGYYNLAAAYEDVKAKTNAADVARGFLENVREQIRLGSVAPPDLIPAQSLEINSRQALLDSRTSLSQQEVQLKNLLSRSGTADPDLAGVRILPVDPIAIPEKDDLPPLDELVKQAIANRSDLAAARINDAAGEISALGTRNGLRPNLQVFAAESHAGLAGTGRTVGVGPRAESPDPYFTGGIGTAVAQIFRRNFPTERAGAFYQAPVHNWTAQADFAIDQLQNRQSDLATRKSLNQVQVDVLNYVVMLQQARARYDAAVRNRALQAELFAGEHRRFTLGASTPYNVTQQQRDLIAAQNAEMGALVSYTTARLALDQTLGSTLLVNHVEIAEARAGRVAAAPVAPR